MQTNCKKCRHARYCNVNYNANWKTRHTVCIQPCTVLYSIVCWTKWQTYCNSKLKVPNSNTKWKPQHTVCIKHYLYCTVLSCTVLYCTVTWTKWQTYCNSRLNVPKCNTNWKSKHTLCIQHCPVLYCTVSWTKCQTYCKSNLNFQTLIQTERHNTTSVFSTVLYSIILYCTHSWTNYRHTLKHKSVICNCKFTLVYNWWMYKFGQLYCHIQWQQGCKNINK